MQKLTPLLLTCLLLPLTGQARDLKVGLQGDYPPFDYEVKGQLTGFNVDIANAVCRELKARCVFVKTTWGDLIPGIESGKLDAVIASMSITEERKKRVAFSDKYSQIPGSFVSRKKRILSTYITPQDLAGMKIGVQAKTTYANLIQARFATSNKVTEFEGTKEMYEAMRAGEVDVVLDDMVAAYEGFLKKPEGANYELAGSPIRDRKYLGVGEGVAVNLKNTALLAEVNAALKNIQSSGEYQQIMKKYFQFNIY